MNSIFKRTVTICLCLLCLLSMQTWANEEDEFKSAMDSSVISEETNVEEINASKEEKIPEEAKKQISFLKAFDILPSNVDFSKDITREETAVVLVKMLGKDNLARSSENVTYYTDVSVYSQNVGYINVATNEELFSGRSETIFDPESAVTYAELSKLLVKAVGYSSLGERKGGFPGGYITAASQLKILDDVKLTGKTTVSWVDAAKMVYNAMSVDVLTGTVYTADGDFLEMGKSQGDNLLKVCHGAFKAKGQITGTAICKIFGTGLDRELKVGEIEIKGNLFSYDPEKLSHLETLTGFNTEYYYTEKDGEYILKFAYIEDSSSISVMSYDITNVYGFADGETSGAYLEYFIDDLSMEEPEKLELSDELDLIVNNIKQPRVSNELLFPECGKVTLVDSDDDEVYDLAKVVKYDMKIVDVVSIYDKHIFFKNDPTTTPLTLNPLYNDVTYDIYQDGEKISLRDLTEGDIVGIVEGERENDPYYLIEKLSSTVEGTVEQIGSDEVVIDGKTFGVSPTFDLALYDIHPGDHCKLYFDFADELFYAEPEDDGYTYHYVLLGAAVKRGGRGRIQIKVVHAPDRRNKTVHIYDAAEEVKINDKKYQGRAIIDALRLGDADRAVVRDEFMQPLKYVEFNEAGEICMIETIKENELGRKTTSTRAQRTYIGSGPYNEAFGEYPITYLTQYFYVPLSGRDVDWGYTDLLQVVFGTSYDTIMWGTDVENSDFENGIVYPEAVFVYHNRTTTDNPTYLTDRTRPMIIKKVKKQYDPNVEDEYYRVETLNSGGTFVYLSHLNQTNHACFEDLKPGDIVFAALTGSLSTDLSAKISAIVGGQIWSCERLLRLSDKSLSYYRANDNMYGVVKTIRIEPKINKAVINMSLGDDGEQSYDVSGVPIYYYDRGDDTVALATYAAIKSEEVYGPDAASNIFVFLDEEGDPKMIVIVDNQ